MVVKCNNELCSIQLIYGGEVVFKSNTNILHHFNLGITTLSNIKPATKTYKEETLEKVMEAWKGQGIDFAYDGVNSMVCIKSVFDVVYDVMKSKEK
jgi:hypothetical protein